MSRIVVVALLIASPAWANVGRAHFPGARSTEPAGLRAVAIASEQLHFDLRPLAAREPAIVDATYQLDNASGAPVTAPLVFVSGASSAGEIAVALDGVQVRGGALDRAARATFPPSWSAPLTTPALDGEGALGYEADDSAALAFTLTIPPGHHQLAVRYGAQPQWNRSTSGGTIIYQLGYVLAPARDWGGFGGLEVSLDVPAGWRAAVSPALERTGDTLRARFPALPGDALGITVQAPTGALHRVLQLALPLVALLVLIGGGFALLAIGRARGRAGAVLAPLWPVSLPASLGWAVAIAVAGGFTAVRSELALPPGQSAGYGYGAGFGILLAVVVGLAAIPIGMLIARAGCASPQER